MIENVKRIGTQNYSARIDGVEWSGIGPQSRFWQQIQEYIAAGGLVIPLQPSPHHDWNGTVWVEDIEKKRAAKETAIRDEGAKRLESLALPYQQQERDTWETQLKEAEAYQANPSTPTPMLDAIAAGRGLTKAALVAKVMENANLFRAAAGQILGRQQALLDQLATATSAQIDAINWP